MKKIFAIVIIVAVCAVFGLIYLNKKSIVHQLPVVSENNLSAKINSTIQISSGNIPDIPLKLPSGFVIHMFASGLVSPRVLVYTPGGTLLVSDIGKNQVIALPDKNHDGVADTEKVVIDQENHPHGLAFYNGKLYVADVDKIVRYNWDESSLTATLDKSLFSLPENNDHNNRTITFDKSGNMYVSVGSTCNVCNENNPKSATVLISDADGNNPRIFAKGLRNAAFTAINSETGELWGTEMGRDYLGDNLPPDEINILRQGLDYGWPYCYGEKQHDNNYDPFLTHSCEKTTSPLYEFPAHSAPLGLAFINSSQFPAGWQGDLLVSFHGSWNRSVPTGYKVVHLKVNGNTITGIEDFLTGFLPPGTINGPSDALGRPVDLTFDKLGNLYLSDDKSGNIYIIQKKQ